jgi:hypothetical protein
MKRTVMAFIWFWALWSVGSGLEFLGLAPSLPFIAAGLAISFWLVVPKAWLTAPHHGAYRETARR